VRFVLVWAKRPGLEVNSIPELVALQKRKEKEGTKLTVGYSGIGGANHLAILMLNQMAGIQLLPVAYKGESPSLVDLMGGQVYLVVTTLASAAGPLQGGKIGVIATTTAARAKAMPELKTVAESGFPGYEMEGWGGIFVPAGTPKEIVERLHREIARILHGDEMRDALVKRGSEPVGNTPEQFGAYIRTQSDRIGKLVKDFDVRAN
jgi:tripartite-type tricarboxylate transporter receptor subunit TctC